MGKWSCGCPDDGVVNGIDVAFFDCPLTLCVLQFGIPIYRRRLLSFFRLLVSLLFFVPTFLSLCPSSFFCRPYSSIVGLSSRTFLGLVPFSFRCFCLFLFPLLVYFCVVLCFLCGLCPRVESLFICCCNLRPRNLYLSGRKHRYGIWMYWMAIREEISI